MIIDFVPQTCPATKSVDNGIAIVDEDINLSTIAISQWELKAKAIGIRIFGLGYAPIDGFLCTNEQDVQAYHGIYAWNQNAQNEQILINWSN